MAIYVDPLFEWTPVAGRTVWCHLGTDDQSPEGIEALHRFASRLGLLRRWYQNKPHHKHYDLTPSKRKRALKLGAIPLAQREYALKCGSYPRRPRRTRAEDDPPDEPPPPRQGTLFD